MSVEDLKPHLRAWLTSNSWNTGHESDELNFHRALTKVFEELGYYTAEEDFKEAVLLLVSELHPSTQCEQCEKSANDYASKASAISLYLNDMQKS